MVVEERADWFGDENVFEMVLASAMAYFDATGRHLPVFGERYAERRFGLERHRPGHCGSDGRLGNILVGIKTISPLKRCKEVKVKRAGSFGAFVVVKFDANYRSDAKVVTRRKLPKGSGKWMRVKWPDIRCEWKRFENLLVLPSR